MKPVYVWQCCGALGFSIPWAEWITHGVYPTNSRQEALVYLYSRKGQLGDRNREGLVTPREEQIGVTAICLDEYLDVHLGVQWDMVFARIVEAAGGDEQRIYHAGVPPCLGQPRSADKRLSGGWIAIARDALQRKTGATNNRDALQYLLQSQAGEWKIVEILAELAAQAYSEGLSERTG